MPRKTKRTRKPFRTQPPSARQQPQPQPPTPVLPVSAPDQLDRITRGAKRVQDAAAARDSALTIYNLTAPSSYQFPAVLAELSASTRRLVSARANFAELCGTI